LRVWTYEEAQAAIPYITSVLRSIREHALTSLAYTRAAKRLADRPGRPDRAAIIAHQEAQDGVHRSDESFQEALGELQDLDIYCLDPLQGQALIPFAHDEQLAWYIFDLFDVPPLRFWRFQSDPEDTRRPITAKQKGTAGTTQIV
jgi:hypothetical protein